MRQVNTIWVKHMKITMTQLSGCLKRPQLTVMVMYSPIHMNKLYSKEEFKKLKGIDPVHSPNYKTQESIIKKIARKRLISLKRI